MLVVVLTEDEQIINNLGDLICEVCSEFYGINEDGKWKAKDLIRSFLPVVKDFMKKKDITPSDIRGDNESLKGEVRELVVFMKPVYESLKMLHG